MIKDPLNKARCLLAVVAIFPTEENIKEIKEIATGCHDQRSNMLKELVYTLIEAEKNFPEEKFPFDHRRLRMAAEEIARTITDSKIRTQTLIRCAQAFRSETSISAAAEAIKDLSCPETKMSSWLSLAAVSPPYIAMARASAEAVTDLKLQVMLLFMLAKAFPTEEHFTLVRSTALSLVDPPFAQALVHLELADIAPTKEHLAAAEAAIPSITDTEQKERAQKWLTSLLEYSQPKEEKRLSEKDDASTQDLHPRRLSELAKAISRAQQHPTLKNFIEWGVQIGDIYRYFGDILQDLIAWTDAFMGAELPVTASPAKSS